MTGRPPPAEEIFANTREFEPGDDRRRRARDDDEPLPIKFWGDLEKTKPFDRLVRRLLGTCSLVLIYGEPACGKSFFATHLGLHIALGWPWFGRAVSQGAVVYIAAEGASGLANRVTAFRRSAETPPNVPFTVIPVSVNFGPDGQDARRVIAAVQTVERVTGLVVQAVIIDTVARAMGHGDENAAQDMNTFVANCDKVRVSTGATVIGIHHKGKSQQSGARGSTVLTAAVDTGIEVEKREGGRVAVVRKQKDGPEGEEIGFRLDVIEIGRDEDDEPITSCIVQPTEEIAKEAVKLTPIERRAMKVLHNVLVDFGERPPNSVTFPNVTVVKIEHFRKALRSGGVTDRDKPDSERSQWKRISTGLANKGVFVMKDDYCWPA